MGYLLTEMVIGRYLSHFGIEEPDLANSEREALMNRSYDLQNFIPKTKKVELQNTVNQADIEQYYQQLIDRYVILPASRL